MKKLILFAAALCISVLAYCQTTPAGSFEFHVKGSPNISQADIRTNITKLSFENYRLRDHRTILSFDNGFEIILFSANELKEKGIISDASRYQAEFIQGFVMPVFHMTPDGKVSAAYPVINSKYSSEKR